MFKRQCRITIVALTAVLFSWQAAMAGSVAASGVDISSASLETVLGSKVAELDAKGIGFSFGGATDPHRNLNVTTQVFQASSVVDLGGVVLQPGDYTFAYTLDYTDLSMNGTVNSPVQDLQLNRVIESAINGATNAGPHIAVDQVKGAAYNTAAEFNGRPFDGVSSYQADAVGFIMSQVEFSYSANDQLVPGEAAMALLFTGPDIEVWQCGWDSTLGDWNPGTGDSLEGGDLIGGGGQVGDIPVLVPVVPEPATLALLGGSLLVAVRRRG
jgi:hypothetical protein